MAVTSPSALYSSADGWKNGNQDGGANAFSRAASVS
jgi:hypothetical protein